jgi:CheY-like chemotaxis protein
MKLKVLVCEDAKVIRLVIRKVLEESGLFEVAGETESGDECIAEYESKKPGLVVLDLNLPGKDGVETARELLSSDAGANILVCTSRSLKRKAASLEPLGIKNVIYKPFDEYDFLLAAMRACGML